MRILSPEYKLIDDKKKYLQTVGTIDLPYQFGMIYNDEKFITQLISLISKSLNKKPEKPTDTDAPYDSIPDSSNFYGIMLFKFTNSDCRFIEGFKLSGTTLTHDPIMNQFYNKPLKIKGTSDNNTK